MRRTGFLLTALAAGLLAGAAPAQDEPAAEKRALVRELLEIAGAATAAGQVTEVVLAELQVVFEPMVEAALESETELSAEQREALRRHLLDFERFAATFRLRLRERVDLRATLEAAYAPLYEQRFSQEELAQIVAFYRTPAGRKLVTAFPEIQQEGFARTLPVVQPAVMEVVGEVLAERRAAFQREEP
jgi:hypothetical protein